MFLIFEDHYVRKSSITIMNRDKENIKLVLDSGTVLIILFDNEATAIRAFNLAGHILENEEK